MAAISGPVLAQEGDQAVELDDLLAQLADPETGNWQTVERQIRNQWAKSGSAALDLLYQRGEEALAKDDLEAALEHFTALTDHAPDFAEGWNGRAKTLFKSELYGPAMQDLGRVLALNPNHFEAMGGLAVILHLVGMDQQSLDVWRMVAKVHPHQPEMQDAIHLLEQELGGETL